MKPLTHLHLLFISLLMVTASYAQLIPVAYADNTQKLNGLAIQPSKSNDKKGGVLILPAWMGIDENAKASAEKLAAAGYHVFIADIYGEGNYPTDGKKAGELSSYYKKNTADYKRRIQLALAELVKTGANPKHLVIIGYCFGGTGALEAARANFPVAGVVSFHGGLGRDTTKAIEPIKPAVLVCHGANDPYVPEAQVKAFQGEMKQAKADWQMIYYADAVHAFTEKTAGNDPSKGVAYNEKAANRSWEHFMDFLQELFK